MKNMNIQIIFLIIICFNSFIFSNNDYMSVLIENKDTIRTALIKRQEYINGEIGINNLHLEKCINEFDSCFIDIDNIDEARLIEWFFNENEWLRICLLDFAHELNVKTYVKLLKHPKHIYDKRIIKKISAFGPDKIKPYPDLVNAIWNFKTTIDIPNDVLFAYNVGSKNVKSFKKDYVKNLSDSLNPIFRLQCSIIDTDKQRKQLYHNRTIFQLIARNKVSAIDSLKGIGEKDLRIKIRDLGRKYLTDDDLLRLGDSIYLKELTSNYYNYKKSNDLIDIAFRRDIDYLIKFLASNINDTSLCGYEHKISYQYSKYGKQTKGLKIIKKLKTKYKDNPLFTVNLMYESKEINWNDSSSTVAYLSKVNDWVVNHLNVKPIGEIPSQVYFDIK